MLVSYFGFSFLVCSQKVNLDFWARWPLGNQDNPYLCGLPWKQKALSRHACISEGPGQKLNLAA